MRLVAHPQKQVAFAERNTGDNFRPLAPKKVFQGLAIITRKQ
jgi:hypothetical protein